ncbi:MAG: Mfa1 fimbrilin C-terminal domain-containing protein [Bacteroidaceae bacterium]|nr:Mfa1 fimbrilin C-terminal domain-containing protein [Bacteroidaceae bacterium]
MNNAILLIFKGKATDADAATLFQSAYNLDTSPFGIVGTTTDGCTTEARLTALLQQKEEQIDDEIYAYVILNGGGEGGVFYVNADHSLKITTATGSVNLTTGTTFATFSKYELAAAKIGALGNMLMTSAPNSNKQGGSVDPAGAKVSALAKLDKTKIYNTAALAKSNPAAEVYVGRSAVKVEVTTNFPTTTTITGNPDVTFDGSSFVWTLGNTNKTFYIGRQFNDNWLSLYAPGPDQEVAPADIYKYRFVGDNFIHEGVYRTYWGEDPNYDDDYTAGMFDNEVPAETAFTKKSGDVVYTTENTMDEDHMIHELTTYVAIGVTLNGGAEFYTVPNQSGSDVIYDETNIKKFVKSMVAEMYAWEQFKNAAGAGVTVDANVSVALDISDPENVAVTLSTDIPAATADFTPVQTAYSNKMKDTPIYYYEGGMTYYYLPIQHFSNVETPWNATNKASADYADTYPATNRADYYLGRWGVLRNNWYKLEVTGIRHIGKPEPDDPGSEPDDEVDKYISVKIHVMPWTIRTQSNIQL